MDKQGKVVAFVSQQKSNIIFLVAVVIVLATVFYLFNLRSVGLAGQAPVIECASPRCSGVNIIEQVEQPDKDYPDTLVCVDKINDCSTILPPNGVCGNNGPSGGATCCRPGFTCESATLIRRTDPDCYEFTDDCSQALTGGVCGTGMGDASCCKPGLSCSGNELVDTRSTCAETKTDCAATTNGICGTGAPGGAGCCVPGNKCVGTIAVTTAQSCAETKVDCAKALVGGKCGAGAPSGAGCCVPGFKCDGNSVVHTFNDCSTVRTDCGTIGSGRLRCVNTASGAGCR